MQQHYHVPAGDVAQVHHHVHVRRPQLDLALPGGERGQGHHQQKGPVQLVLLEQVAEEGDGLDGLAQAHLVCQDTAVPSADRLQNVFE